MSAAFRLEGKRALVTGANTGIGQAIATGLADAGAHVICCGRRSCEETVSFIEAANGGANGGANGRANGKGSGESLHMDLADLEGSLSVMPDDLDILVNNAGIIRRDDSVDFSEADWDDVMDVNLKAVFRLCQTFAKAAIGAGRGGRIVNIASLLSFQGGIRVPSYTASKHGVAGLTKILANEWATKGINVNAVAPGYIATNNTEALRRDPERSKAILERIPSGRWGDPADIAGAVTFLCAPAAGYVTGAVLNVDGGWLAR